MAQFNFFGTWEDSERYLSALSQTGSYTFVIDMWYTKPVPFRFTSLTDESRTILKERPRLWLWSDSYSRFPVTFSQPTSEGWIMIDPANCGPALDLMLPLCFEREGKIRLVAGSLSYQSRYSDPTTGQLYRPPETLEQAYKKARALLCKRMKRHFVSSQVVHEGNFKPVIESIWIGLDAVRMLNSEKTEVQINGEWRRGIELSETRDQVKPYRDE